MLESQRFVPALHNLKVHTAPLSRSRWVRHWSSAKCRLHCANRAAEDACGILFQYTQLRLGKLKCTLYYNTHFCCAVIWYFQQIHAEYCFSSASPHLPGCGTSRLFLQSKIGRELLQGKNSFAQMSLSSRDEDDQDGGLYQPQKTHRHTSAVRWTIIQIVPVKSLLQSPLSGLRLLQVQIADAGDRETIAKTDVWSETTENSTKFSYTQWCTGCRIGENKIIF